MVLPVGGQLVEPVGSGTRLGEVAGEDIVAAEARGVDDVAVDVVEVGGIEEEVPVGVDVHTSPAPDADLRPAVDGKSGREVAARLPVAAGELRILVRLDRVRLAVEGVPHLIDDGVGDRQREAIVGQRRADVVGRVEQGVGSRVAEHEVDRGRGRREDHESVADRRRRAERRVEGQLPRTGGFV